MGQGIGALLEKEQQKTCRATQGARGCGSEALRGEGLREYIGARHPGCRERRSWHVLLLLQVEAGRLRGRYGGLHLGAHGPQVRSHGGRGPAVRRKNRRSAQSRNG